MRKMSPGCGLHRDTGCEYTASLLCINLRGNVWEMVIILGDLFRRREQESWGGGGGC